LEYEIFHDLLGGIHPAKQESIRESGGFHDSWIGLLDD